MARAASLTVASATPRLPLRGEGQEAQIATGGPRALSERRDEFVELLNAMQVSQARSAPAMEPEKVADLLHDLADPTPAQSCTAFATRTS
jgi:hypothetical protein